MFMRYYGGGIGHGDSAAAAELEFDLGEIVYESPDAHPEIEDTDEESDDDDDDDRADDPGESTDEEMANIF